ncbi:pre-mRNA-splicing factor [Fragilaria crotonensis]|nr:pre-mRNA-splicing factor [Fragilaria crotonensis]
MWDLAAGKCFTTLTHHMKSVRALTQPSFEHTFVSGAPDCLKKWQGKDGRFIKSYRGHNAVVNALAVNDDGVLSVAAMTDRFNFGIMKLGTAFRTSTVAQPGSLEAENGIFASAFDLTGTRLITCEADKSVKIWKQDDEASDESHPIDMSSWRKECIAESKMRY